ncbi:MAG: phosphatase PAP2 family protein [Phycisphaerales bacterium]|nr:phosphatase PAP2 family protein [Phycisphaerales bacterium]
MSTVPPAPKLWWLWPLLVGVLGFVIIYPFDGPLSHAAAHLEQALGGDLRRELHAWQQFGQGFFVIVIALTIWLLDPIRRRRLLDLLLLTIVCQLASSLGKLFIGRPRPRPQYEDPHTFLFPWGTYPITVKGSETRVHAWDIAAGANSDLWSMPSSHTLFAFAAAAFLGVLYPPLRWLTLALAALVGFGRVLFDAHWPTDVVVGAVLGWLIAFYITHQYLGVRLLDAFWVRFVNRSATPAFPALFEAEGRTRFRR